MIVGKQQSKRVVFHQLPNGKEPFVDWLNSMKDAKSRRRVLQRLSRLESGNFGDCKPLKDGVSELRLHFGSGYRVYYAEQGDTVVINQRKAKTLLKQKIIGVVMKTNNLRTLEEVTKEYFVTHPDEIDSFVKECFEEYSLDGDSAALLSQLRIIARVKGVSSIADKVGITRQGVQKALSGKGNPRFDNITAILGAMGYQLLPQPIALQP